MKLEMQEASEEDLAFAWSIYRDYVRTSLFSGAAGKRKPVDWNDANEYAKFSQYWSRGDKYLITVDAERIGWSAITIDHAKVVIQNWHTVPEWRARGVGSIILGELIAKWKASGLVVEGSLLLGAPTTEGAEKFALKLGFSPNESDDYATLMRI